MGVAADYHRSLAGGWWQCGGGASRSPAALRSPAPVPRWRLLGLPVPIMAFNSNKTRRFILILVHFDDTADVQTSPELDSG